MRHFILSSFRVQVLVHAIGLRKHLVLWYTGISILWVNIRAGGADMLCKTIYAEVGEDGVFIPETGKRKMMTMRTCWVLLANTPQTVIRIVVPPSISQDLPGLLRTAFPWGGKMNDETHIFSHCVFAVGGQVRVLLAALPKHMADQLAQLGIAAAGSARRVRRLDVIENHLFRHYAPQAAAERVLWICLPQGDGLRILVMYKGLPQDAHFISAHPNMRDAALDRLWQAGVPARGILLARHAWQGETWIKTFFAERLVPAQLETIPPV